MLSDDYEWFLTLAEVEHPSDAAALLGIPQPTLSRRLAGLERRVGTRLFDRGGRSLRLNDRGRAMVPVLEDVVRSLIRGESDLGRLLDPETGRVRFGFMPSLGPWLAPRILRSFLSAHPRADVEISQATAEALISDLTKGELDVVLSAPEVMPAHVGDLEIVTVHRQSLAVVVPDGHRLAARESVDFADVAFEPFVAAPSGSTTRNILDRLAQSAGVAPRIVLESDSLATHAGLASTGVGIAVLPDDDPSLHVPGTVFLPLRTVEKREISIVWRPASLEVPIVASFIEEAMKEYGGVE
ncbi:LysR family transcriptional regulator [Flaviflexus equikiangi]|uniref:LysR family transcriptional regulator n=1 Tax=Flaviflexus equikiangi TaxID=2758573 RepID=A0ABS2TH64_9ACTO|nr:LysR family transcriptional regulator [Flaviflexus equikiangi]MBM9433995.1 LysR family transcriptional regulator [Flaviflexus equikiangi]